MRPDLQQWFAIILLAGVPGIAAGGWFILLGPAALALVVARNRYEAQSDGTVSE